MMSGLEESKSFKNHLKRIFAPVVKSSTKHLICAWIQVTGSAALATYMYENGRNGILPILLSAIGIGGTYNYIEILRKNSSYIEIRRKWSLWDFAFGTFTYSTGVYAFSEFFRCNDMMWIPCLVLAASGYYFTISSISSLDAVLNIRPLLKCCQLMSEPALVGCAATYLFYFRNHTEEWLKCLHFLVTAASGLKLADRGCLRYASMYHSIVLKAIEMCIGGSILCISCAALAIYSSANDFYFITAFMSFWSLYGAFVAIDSLPWFQICIEMEEPVFHCICGMIGGPIVFLLACFSFKCISHPIMLPLYFVISGTGLALLGKSVFDLDELVPQPVFISYYWRVMGPVMTVYSSLYATYVGYHMGWRFSFVIIPFIASGIYVTYDSFRRRDFSQ